MVFDPELYAKQIPINGKYVSERTIRRMAKKGLLPSHTRVHYFKRGMILEIETIPEHIKENFIVKLKPKIKQKLKAQPL